MSAPTLIVATDHSPVRVRRAPRLEPPFDDEDDPNWPPVGSTGRTGMEGGHVPAGAGQAGLAGQPGRAGHVPVGAGAVNALTQPGRGPRTQRPVTPRPLRGPTEPPGATQAGPIEAGTAQAGSAQAGSTQAGPAQAGITAVGAAQAGIAPVGVAHPGSVETRAARAGTATHAGLRPGPGRRQPTPGAIAAQRFVGVCIEILNGHRAVSHLRAVTAPGDLKQITDQLVGRTNRTYLGRPGRTVTAPQRVRLLGMRTCEPRDGVVEVAVVLGYGIHTWAMAIRMERPADVWLCKLIQVV